ncbi:MAG: hypothetical protein WDW38_004376 [Sanguina aurantia]
MATEVDLTEVLAAVDISASTTEDTTPRKYKIYTKTGDSGTSSLYNGARHPKDAQHFVALGDVDELNCAVGVARQFVADHPQLDALGEQLEIIQSRLLDVGSAVATPMPTSSAAKLKRTFFSPEHTTIVEGWIDAWDEELPALTNFILPSGGKASAFLHIARAICRRAERSVVVLSRQEDVDTQVAVYLNRLSDYFFNASRVAALRTNAPEVIYRKGQ